MLWCFLVLSANSLNTCISVIFIMEMGNPLVEKNESWENKVDINIIPAFYKLTIAVCFSTIIIFSSTQVMGRSYTARRYRPKSRGNLQNLHAPAEVSCAHKFNFYFNNWKTKWKGWRTHMKLKLQHYQWRCLALFHHHNSRRWWGTLFYSGERSIMKLDVQKYCSILFYL